MQSFIWMNIKLVLKMCIKGDPRTKKNSMRIIIGWTSDGKPYPRPIPSKAFSEYEEVFLWQIKKSQKLKIDFPVNIKCVYYMKTRRKVDLLNLLGATMDILVSGGVLKDDNSSIVVSHDGSRVLYDKENPRVEIEIERI